jgi:bifunctional non-homologous end joining protein LigD
VVAAARKLRALLAARDLECWVKTTGGKGLHVVAPFRPEHAWDAVFAFTRDLATTMAEDDPERYVVDFSRGERTGRVLIDYKRNHRTSIAVAGFSLRARPDAPIAVPVRWEELPRVRSDQWNATNIANRLNRLKADPWKGFWISRQRLRT